jgi:hypothetical protein
MTADRTPAQLYALLFGAVLLIVGILGFISESSLGAVSDVHGSDFIIFEGNGWHNIVHILSGLLGLAMWRRPASARAYALGFGAVYLVVTIWGFIIGDQVLWLHPRRHRRQHPASVDRRHRPGRRPDLPRRGAGAHGAPRRVNRRDPAPPGVIAVAGVPIRETAASLSRAMSSDHAA